MDGRRWMIREVDEEPWKGKEMDYKPYMRGLNRGRERLFERLEIEKAIAEGKPFECPCILDSRRKVPLLPIRFRDRFDLEEDKRRETADRLNQNLDPVVGSEDIGNVGNAGDEEVHPYESVNFFQVAGFVKDKNMTEEENKMVKEESKKRKNGTKKEKEKEKKICKERKKKKKMALQPDAVPIRRCEQLHSSS